MKKIKVILEEIAKLQTRYARAIKKKRILSRPRLKIEFVKKEKIKPIPKINNLDLAALHKKFANNDNDRQYFLDSLYDKYFVSRETHRISIKDGEIKEKKF